MTVKNEVLHCAETLPEIRFPVGESENNVDWSPALVVQSVQN